MLQKENSYKKIKNNLKGGNSAIFLVDVVFTKSSNAFV